MDDNILVVADGVSGWNSKGVNPGLNARKLCKNIKKLSMKIKEINQIKCEEILVNSCKNTISKGSSTCCMILFDSIKRTTYTSNLGDSSYLIIRVIDGKLKKLFKSEDQQYSFNFPFQLETNGDSPNIADKNSHPLENNDILIMAYDGHIFINFFQRIRIAYGIIYN